MTSFDDKIVDGSSSSSSSSNWNSSSTDQQQQQRAFIVSMPATSSLGISNVSTTLHAESDSVSNQGTTTTTPPLTRNSMNQSNGPQMFIASPMYNKLTAVFVEELKSGRNRSGSEALLGWTSAFINICFTFPLNKMIFRQQLHGFTAKSAIVQLYGEGLGSLYRGVLPPLIQKSCSVAIMFGSYDQFKSSLHHSSMSSNLHPAVVVCSAAVAAGWCEAVLMPFERVQTLLQDSSQSRQFKNTKDAFLRLPVEYSFREYYRGLSAILIRNGLSNVFFFSLRTPISLFTQELGAPKPASDFASGAMLGACISTVMYPLNTVKTHMQINLGTTFVGIYQTFLQVLRARGGEYKKLFRGVHLNCTRALMSWGVINMSYEYLKHILLDEDSR